MLYWRPSHFKIYSFRSFNSILPSFFCKGKLALLNQWKFFCLYKKAAKIMISRTSGIDWKSLLLTNVLTIRHAENKVHQPSTAKDFQRPESKNKPSVTNPNSPVTKTWIQDFSWSGLKFLFLCKLFSFYVFSNFCDKAFNNFSSATYGNQNRP